nr:DUF342 domain-containing protein [FCB group bacterium]
LAAVNGAYKRDKSGRISVSEVFKVDSDVDYRTGNIRCSASAEIEGDVKAGFEVHVEGDLEVKGLVENADIEVKGDLAVRYGFTQGAAPVTVGGELRAMYIYNRSLIKAGSLQIKEMIGFSDLIVDGDVTANRIVGGKIIAKGDIVCEEIGSAQHESKTYIIAGLDFAKKKERDKVKEEFEEEREALQKLRKENVDLAKWAAEFKKNAGKVMEEITQIASSEIAAKVQQNLKQKIARIREITFEIENLENFIKENEVKIEELNKALQNPKAKVIVNGTVFAGVHITIGENAVYQLKNPRRKVQFRLNNEGEIIVENL